MVLEELEANMVIFALMLFNFLLIAWVKISFLQLFFGILTIVVAAILNGTTVFPYLNLMLILTAIYSIIDSMRSVK